MVDNLEINVYGIVNCVGSPLEIYFKEAIATATQTNPEHDEAEPENVFRHLLYANQYTPTIKGSSPEDLAYYDNRQQGSTNLQYGGESKATSYDLMHMNWNLPNVPQSSFQVKKMILKGSRDAVWKDYEYKDIILGKPTYQNLQPLFDVYLALKDQNDQGYDFIDNSSPVGWSSDGDPDDCVRYISYEVPEDKLDVFDASMLLQEQFKITGQTEVMCPEGSSCGDIEDYRYNLVLGNYNLTIDYTYSIEIESIDKDDPFDNEVVKAFLSAGTVVENGTYSGIYSGSNEIKWQCKWSGTETVYVDATEVNVEESYIGCPYDSMCGSECQIDVSFLAEALPSEFTNSGLNVQKNTGCQYDSDCNNGTCNNSIDTCECNDGYDGEFCKVDLCERDLDNCNSDKNQGTCVYNKKDGHCECNEEEGYTGTTCNETFCDDVDCNQEQEGGVCVMNTGECKCNSNYTGSDCKTIACPYNTDKCNGHGECNTTTAKCDCDKGYLPDYCEDNICLNMNCGNGECIFNNENGTARCDCEEGWIDEDCTEVACPENKCNGHGDCNPKTGDCECYEGYLPNYCKYNICKNMDCGNGECEFINESGTAKCNCEEGWIGENCTEVACPENICNGHGDCDPKTGDCDCDEGYLPDYCENNLCINMYCGNGECEFNNENGTAKCNCDEGWIGEDCEEVACPENKCNGHGDCDPLTGDCDCEEGWIGDKCENESNITDDTLNLSRTPLLALFSILIVFFLIL
ncbi:tenascin [Anaeramoeba flamelloides]|uniref:Tenascin n=1 Tax=Anaeramoeba flamelloides TaxID=1746091 RepID=A0AAV7ZEI7_9EUKA|nr:tenascin [Anaeramoeba flamelloides]